MTSIDEKISILRGLTKNFLFIEFYPHTNKYMWKILNEYTLYAEDKIVLCPFEDGIEAALDVAIPEIEKRIVENSTKDIYE